MDSKTIRTLSAAAALAAGLALAPAASAAPMIPDNYVGGDDHGWGDVIGDPAKFDTSGMDIELDGTSLTVTVYTAFAGRGDDGLFANHTYGKGIGYGDLFLASEWTPYGDAPYTGDNAANGTQWTYGFSLANRWNGGGSGILYALDGDDIFLSDVFITNATFRNGQEVAVNSTSAEPVSQGEWWIDTDLGAIGFAMDIAGTTLMDGPGIAAHWGPTCQNDVIEGYVPAAPVPEPATMVLLGSGLLGLAGVSRKKLRRT